MNARKFAVSLTAAAVMGMFGAALAQTSTDNNVNVSPNSGVSAGQTSSGSAPSASCTCPDQTNVQGDSANSSVSGSVNGASSSPSANCSCPGANSSSGSSAAGGSSSSSVSSSIGGGSSAAGAGDDPESQSAQDKADARAKQSR